MILTGNEIIKEVSKGHISIYPFSQKQINPNSYNYRLGNKLKVFKEFNGEKSLFDEIEIPDSGYILDPLQMYLGHTLEIIGSKKYAMSLIGRSSVGRLGLFLQISANLGHTNSEHQWTLEMVALKKFKLYPGMLMGQVSFWENYGISMPYHGRYGRYNDPKESIMI